jgi:hypothetical protein
VYECLKVFSNPHKQYTQVDNFCKAIVTEPSDVNFLVSALHIGVAFIIDRL